MSSWLQREERHAGSSAAPRLPARLIPQPRPLSRFRRKGQGDGLDIRAAIRPGLLMAISHKTCHFLRYGREPTPRVLPRLCRRARGAVRVAERCARPGPAVNRAASPPLPWPCSSCAALAAASSARGGPGQSLTPRSRRRGRAAARGRHLVTGTAPRGQLGRLPGSTPQPGNSGIPITETVSEQKVPRLPAMSARVIFRPGLRFDLGAGIACGPRSSRPITGTVGQAPGPRISPVSAGGVSGPDLRSGHSSPELGGPSGGPVASGPYRRKGSRPSVLVPH